MKKVIKIGAFAFAGALLFASCKKDWTCECTVGSVTTPSSIKNAKKKDAKKTCDALGSTASIVGGSCTLK